MSLNECGWQGYLEKPESSLDCLGNDALEFLLREYDFQTVLDVGCGTGVHTKVLEENGKQVTSIALGEHGGFRPTIVGNYMEVQFMEKFDAIWCCHMIEHIPNIGLFLEKLYDDLADDGILALTAPPAKHEIVSGHITIWNPGLLLYNLVLNGFNCRHASVKCYGYNISIITRKIPTGPIGSRYTIDDLAEFFPMEVQQGFDGRIGRFNW